MGLETPGVYGTSVKQNVHEMVTLDIKLLAGCETNESILTEQSKSHGE